MVQRQGSPGERKQCLLTQRDGGWRNIATVGLAYTFGVGGYYGGASIRATRCAVPVLPKTDMPFCTANVRFRGQSGHSFSKPAMMKRKRVRENSGRYAGGAVGIEPTSFCSD